MQVKAHEARVVFRIQVFSHKIDSCPWHGASVWISEVANVEEAQAHVKCVWYWQLSLARTLASTTLQG